MGTHPTLAVSVAMGLSLVAAAPTAVAGGAERSSTVTLAPFVGFTAESEVVDGAVVFSDGGVDSILIDPDTGVLVGLELAARFRPKVTGVLALAFSSVDATYIEDGDLRLDVEIETMRIQPGVLMTVMQSSKTELAFGGGLTLARSSIDRMVWNDVAIRPSSTSVGLYGIGALDATLSPRVAFHTHLALELNRPTYGDLEAALAAADGEAGARVDHDTRTALVFVVGAAFRL